MPGFPVSEKKARDLRDRMMVIRCSEHDLQERFFRGVGVDIQHLPTGIRIRCCRENSQGLNRFLARRLLVEELEARLQNKTRHEIRAEKIREEKRRTRRLSNGNSRPAQAGHNVGLQSGPSKGLEKMLTQLENYHRAG